MVAYKLCATPFFKFLGEIIMKRLINVNGITKIYYNPSFEEYSVVIVGLSDESTYFTDDKEDAFDTAHYINNHRNKYGFDCFMTTEFLDGNKERVKTRKFFRTEQEAVDVANHIMVTDSHVKRINIKPL